MRRAILLGFSRSTSAKSGSKFGFTLIEMSIVLVIIGLIVGGILVGQDLVRAANVRAQITQVEKFNTAVNTFYGKFNFLPGDIPAGPAAQFGFIPRGQYRGEGDGNGVLEGVFADAVNSVTGYCEGMGETAVFWVDLSTAHFIDSTFNTAASNGTLPQHSTTFEPNFASSYFPAAKIGQGNFVYAWSGGPNSGGNGLNYFGISVPVFISGGLSSTPGLTVAQAAAIDTKIDDGLPQTGRVAAFYNNGPAWAAGGGGMGASGTAATLGSSTTCYDNGGIPGAVQRYSVEISNGSNINCALSFQFQ